MTVYGVENFKQRGVDVNPNANYTEDEKIMWDWHLRPESATSSL
jgi:hypothetical protein